MSDQPEEMAATPDSLGRRFARGAFWSLLGTAGAQACQMAGSVLTARFLGSDSYGELGIVMSTAGMFGALASFGMGLTATRFVSRYRSEDPERAGRVLGLAMVATLFSSVVAGLAMWLSAPVVSQQALRAPHTVGWLHIASLSLALTAVAGTMTGGLTGLEAFRASARVSLIQSLIGLPLRVAAAWYLGVGGAVWSLTIIPGLGLILSAAALRSECRRQGLRVRTQGLWGEFPVLWHFSLPALLAGAMTLPSQWLANAILVNLPDGFSQLGLLNAATQWKTLLLFLPIVIGGVALPLMSSAVGGEDSEEKRAGYDHAFELAQGLSVLSVFPVGAVLACITGPILSIYGESYAGGDLIVIGTIVSAMTGALGVGVTAALQARGRMWPSLGAGIAWGVCLVLSAHFGAARWGGAALAFGGVVGHLLAAVGPYLLLRDGLSLASRRRFVGQAVTPCVLAVGLVLLPMAWRPLCAAPVGLGVLALTWWGLCAPEVRGQVVGSLRGRLQALRRAR